LSRGPHYIHDALFWDAGSLRGTQGARKVGHALLLGSPLNDSCANGATADSAAKPSTRYPASNNFSCPAGAVPQNAAHSAANGSTSRTLGQATLGSACAS